MIKFYAMLCILDGIAISRTNRDIGNMAMFLSFLRDNPLNDISVLTASRLKEYLDSKGYAESTKSAVWTTVGIFLRKMNGFDDLQLKNPFYKNIYESH